MKKIFTLIIGTFVFINLFCQDNNSNTDFFNSTDNINTNAVQKGNFIVEPWYGFPLWGKQLYTLFADSLENFTYNGLGPLGGAVEFMVGVQHEEDIEDLGEPGVRDVVSLREAIHHVEEVLCVSQVVDLAKAALEASAHRRESPQRQTREHTGDIGNLIFDCS